MERAPDKYDVKAARVHGMTVEEVRESERERTGGNVRLVAVDMSFGHVFTLVFKVWASLVILGIPIAIILLLLTR